MASNQPIRAVEVRKDDKINIPQPGSYISGTNSTVAGDTIIDLNANFLGVSNPGNTGFSNKVAIGDVVYINDTLGSPVVCLVSQVVSNTEIKLISGFITSGTSAYKIYRSNGTYAAVPISEQSKTGIEGYSLYVGGTGGGNLSVIPAGSEDTVILKGVAAGSFIPLQVIRVNSTGTDVTDILALE